MYKEDQQAIFFQHSQDFLKAEKNESWQKEEYEQLKEVVRFHEWKYYVQNDPILSDQEYDQLFSLLRQIEEQHPDWITKDSPTQRVSSDLTSSFETVEHYSPMLSLDNAHSEEDLREFDRRLKRKLDIDPERDLEYCVEPKYDGGTIVLVYEKGRLVRAATRGDGAKGDDVTANVRTFRSVPLTVEAVSAVMELRGEALMSKRHFLEMNEEREKKGEKIFANPRNASTGGLRMKDPKEAERRGLDLFIFQLAHESDVDMAEKYGTHAASLDTLDKWGFKTPTEERKVLSGISQVYAYCQEWARKREDYPYEIDGLVIKLNDLKLQNESGATSHHPRWAIAFKFKAKQVTSVLERVEYQVGKTGSITPVAKITPVELAGVTVSSVSLHNEDFITSKDLRIADKVLVERGGDVIPYIVKSFPELRTGKEEEISFPRYCPFAEEEEVPLIRVEGESAWRCVSCTCGKQMTQKLIFHVSKTAMDIDGLGASLIERFVELGMIQDFSDIYNLDYEQIASLEGMGEKSAENLKTAIESAKDNSLRRLLTSLSIHHLGRRAAEILSERIASIFDLQEWTEDQLIEIKDIGPVLAKNIVDYFQDEDKLDVLRKMESYGVNMKQTEEDKPLEIEDDAPLVDKTILFTGALQQMTRSEAKKLAKSAGAKNLSSVSKNLDILVVGEKAGSKLKKAESLGTVEIWTEDRFLSEVNQENNN